MVHLPSPYAIRGADGDSSNPTDPFGAHSVVSLLSFQAAGAEERSLDRGPGSPTFARVKYYSLCEKNPAHTPFAREQEQPINLR